MLHPSDPAGKPEACIDHGLIEPHPEAVPHAKMVMQAFGKSRMASGRIVMDILLDAEEIAEDPPERHCKGGGRILHPVGYLLEPAVPQRYAVNGARPCVEQQIRYDNDGQDAEKCDRR